MIFCGADTISQQYRQLAEECRNSAQTFSDPNARTRMLNRLNMSGRAKKLKRELRRVKAEKTTPTAAVIADWFSKHFG